MKKMNNKGFILAETLIVATFLAATLLFIYIQFNKVTKTYEKSFKYNTVNGLYATNNINNYIKTEAYSKLKTDITSIDYINITTCPIAYFSQTNYCISLLENLNVKTAIFTKENLNESRKNFQNLDQTLMDFINYLNFEPINAYRVIVEFNDGTFASLKIKE